MLGSDIGLVPERVLEPRNIPRVAVVIVTYDPDLGVLGDNLRVLVPRSWQVVVYDNSESTDTAEKVCTLCQDVGAAYLGGKGNVGIAVAQNKAVASLRDCLDGDCAMFLDQDSRVPEDLVPKLRDSFARLRQLDQTAGVLGAVPLQEDGTPYRVEIRNPLENYRRLNFVMSSGSIMKLADLRAAGGFRDDLFIDLVDNELSWRMQQRGQATYIDSTISFKHCVGMGEIISFLGMRSPVSSPFRHYYQVRNLILVGRSGVLGWPVVVKSLLIRLGVICLSGLKAGQPIQRFYFAIKGLAHGLVGRSGRLA